MNRLAVSAASAALLLSVGCMHDGDWSVRKALGWDESNPAFNPKDIPQASLPVASRVEVLGRRIVAQNTFTGIDPLITTIGVKESVLFHQGGDRLYISEGLVDKCKTDAELAAVLCAEMGQMVAEKRAAKNLGRDVDPVRDAGHGGGPFAGGGTVVDSGRDADLAFHQKRYPRGGGATDATKTARDLLTGAGFESADLDRVDSLLKQSDRGEKLRKQMSGSAPEPKWEK